MGIVDSFISSLFNAVPLAKIKADLEQYGHAVVIHALKKGEEKQYVIWGEKDGVLEGRPWDELDRGTLGRVTVELSTGIVTHVPTQDRSLPDVRGQILAAAEDLMYDQELCVFRGMGGEDYCISRNPNTNAQGFTAYERSTGHGVFFDWPTLGLYRGEWLPDDLKFTFRKDFTYYGWMRGEVADKTHVPEPEVASAADVDQDALLACVEAIKVLTLRIEKLEKVVTDTLLESMK